MSRYHFSFLIISSVCSIGFCVAKMKHDADTASGLAGYSQSGYLQGRRLSHLHVMLQSSLRTD